MFIKRSIIEGMWIAFAILLTLLGRWGSALEYVFDSARDTTMLTVVLFLFFSQILAKTGVLEDCLDILVALVGRIPGGAAYATLVASAFMGTMSGSISANIAATGCITIPAMKRSGFSAELASGIQVGGSTLASVLPPSLFIVISFGFLNELYPDTYLFSDFWTFAYYIFAIYFLHRLITVFYLCTKYKIKPMDKSELPDFKTALKKGWKSLFLPFVVFFIFFVNNTWGATFVTDRLGAQGASVFSGSLIIIAPCLAIFYVFLIAKDKKTIKPAAIADSLVDTTKSLVPVLFIMLGGYSISALFADAGIMGNMMADIERFNLPFWAVCVFLPLMLAIVGCFFDGLAVLTLFGPLVMAITASVGISPWLAAAMLPVVIHSMASLTPPYSPGIMVAISISKANMTKTFKQMIIWITGHYAVTLLIYFGIIPMIGSN